MFGKAVLGAMLIVVLMPIAPGLAALGFILIPIVIVILQNKEEKAANTTKYGYCPIRQKVEDLPAEQQARVRAISDEKKIEKDQEIYQMCRNQQAIKGTIIQRLNGDPQYYPSLKQYEHLTGTLPAALGEKLMSAARYESREYTKKKNVFIREDNWVSARNALVSVVNECIVHSN